jgi:hypothetical protein
MDSVDVELLPPSGKAVNLLPTLASAKFDVRIRRSLRILH